MKVKISSIIENQFPEFIKSESPLLVEFIKQYFISQEVKGSSIDLISNLDEYTKIENLTNQVESTTLTADISFDDLEINVISTRGFPETYGLIKINSEIITYTSKTATSFNGCVRGFSGIYNDQFEFKKTESDFHNSGEIVENLSILFLKKFFEKIKKSLIPGFQGRDFVQELNQTTFIQNSKSFYSSKGTDTSFEILFNALYGEKVQVIRPRDYLFTPSSAEYRVSKDLVVEALFGDPLLLENSTLFQDDANGNNLAKGAISKVEQILRGNKTYYVISLDYDFNKDINVSGSVFGEFYIHSKTKITSDVLANSDTIDVDSTAGFPNSGSLLINNEIINYSNKSITQFLGCSNITQNYLKGIDVFANDYAYGYNGNTAIAVRVTGVISEFQEIDIAKQLNPGDQIRLKSLGKTSTDIRTKHWIYNIPVCYNIKSLVLLEESSSKYQIETIDDNNIIVGDDIDIVYKNGSIIQSMVISKLNEKTIVIQGQGTLLFSNINFIEKKLNKAKVTNYPEVSTVTTNVQNVYESEGDVYVAASSIPSYFAQNLNVTDRSIQINQNITGYEIISELHGFFTGDIIVYNYTNNNHLGIPKGTYYIKRNSADSISLASSRANLAANTLIEFKGNANGGISSISYNDLFNKSLRNQKLIRKIPTPTLAENSVETPIGAIGILNNGVEIVNYKSKDLVYYGPIQSIDVVATGEDYDIINPPIIISSDSNGSGLEALCEVKGSLKEIRILNRGLNFTEEPSIKITGGNGFGARAKVELGLFEHSSSFSSSNIVNNTIGFTTYHGFSPAEKVIFKPDGFSRVIGITTDSEYFISKITEESIKLHRTFDDALTGINTISISYNGFSNHRLVSSIPKTKISSIFIVDGGENYTNKRISVSSNNVNVFNNTINVVSHGFKTGEKIVYEGYVGSPIVGLTTNVPYYVTAEKDSFKLSNINSTEEDFFFKTKQYVNFISSGIGTHYFNYEPIVAELTSSSGYTTISAKIQPIFRGEITSVFVSNGGKDYGQENILNYNRQPNIEVVGGSGAVLQAIVTNGKIVQVLIIDSGNNYYAPPSILVNGTGQSAELIPITNSGQIVDVIILNPGYDYDPRNITLTVIPAGSGVSLRTNAKPWTINQIERLFYSGQIINDDGILINSINSNYQLQYVHGYSPRNLRRISTAKKFTSGNVIGQPDLQISSNIEVESDAHSPIIGWSYDGNPIYGPYGFDKETGGSIRYMESGYQINSNAENRPSTALYPEGIFVEDYIFTNSGDLDIHNGRYCVTPEFPNGTYAYFATIAGESVQSDGPFVNFYKPNFPYFIGKTYKSKPETFNFDYRSNQEEIDLNQTSWLRNTAPFQLNSSSSGYNYLFKPFDIIEQTAIVESTYSGSVEGIKIISGGDNYKVKDKLIFSDNNSAIAEVSSIKGKTINKISLASTVTFDVEFSPFTQNSFVGISTLPHPFNDNDIISISNVNKNKSALENTFTISVPKNVLILSENVNALLFTGITTYFKVYGDLNPSIIKENDIYKINEEKIKVLKIDNQSSRLYVERQYENTVGVYHTVGDSLTEIPRRFLFTNNNKNFQESPINRELFFNPKESIGIGLGVTLIFSNPGAGITNIFTPSRSVYFPEHKLFTGDELTYRVNGGSGIVISNNGITTSTLNDNTKLYAVKYSENFIGLSTEKVGIGSTGNFVGYNTTTPAKILYYHTFGYGEKHSLRTNYKSTVGQVNRNIASVDTNIDSKLLPNDVINVIVEPDSTKTIKVFYNSERKLLLVNPREISAIDVDTSNDTIKIVNHNYYTGEKILYSSSSPIGGLFNNGLYYVVVKNTNIIGLSSTYYDSQLEEPNFINLSSQSTGFIYEINPKIEITKKQTLVFDLSDSSLSVFDGSQLTPAFDFNLFIDNDFINEFKTTNSSASFNVSKTGSIGISTNAKLTLRYDNKVPSELYYNLTQLQNLSVFKDSENISGNTINYVNSVFSGTHIISGIGSTSFYYNLSRVPENIEYNKNISYTTRSKNALGPIDKISVISGGSNYKTLPGITSISTLSGSGAILDVESNSIGRINYVSLQDIGYDYPSDLTLTPLTQTPVVLKVIPLTTLKSVKIISQGKNYLTAPDLILLDGLTLKQVQDVDLRYELGDIEVKIIKNSKGINNVTPILIPTNNSNSIKALSFTYNFITREVTAVLSESYSTIEEFPFKIGDRILVENVAIEPDESAKGYNSSAYNFARFTITAITPNLGFANGSITYSLKDYLTFDEYPGISDPVYTTGTITPESFFPVFQIELIKNIFLEDETVTANDSFGVVQYWNKENEFLTISTSDEFVPGMEIVGSGSLAKGIIDGIFDFDSKYTIKSSSIVRKGWRTEKGFIDNEFQRLTDNDYYQNFSYSLKSKVDYSKWDNPVSSLNHIAGFKKFSDLIIESEEPSGITTIQDDSAFDVIVSHDSEVDLNCFDDFDLVAENSYNFDDKIGSNEIYFKSQILQNYFQVVGNRVLNIDDISSQFDGIKTEFILKSNGLGIFRRTFDAENPNVVDVTSSSIKIENHYFTNGEKISYSHDGSPIGINTTVIAGIGTTDLLPNEVYIIKYSESEIAFSDTAENAIKEIPIPLVLSNVGIGSSHVLTSSKQNTKVLISLGGVIQSPIVSTNIITRLSSNVGIASTVLFLHDVENFSSGNFAKINNEIIKVVTVGLASTNSIHVERGLVGTLVTEHASNDYVHKISGHYNIINDTIHFVESPKGPTPIGTTTGSQENVDFVGITTTLNFNGRVFLRNGTPNTTLNAYETNYVFDDISENFNGITTSFILKENGADIVGIYENNASILVGDVFQSPADFAGVTKIIGSYVLEETTGITSIRFLGNSEPKSYDANVSNIPVGGSIISIGYSGGYGLQPLVAAGGTATVSIAGTIQSISIGNSGSGYRSGLQTVRVGVYVSTTEDIKYVGIASIINGNAISVEITNPGFGYTATNPPIVEFDYPLPYTNIDLITSGIGTGAKIDMNVGMGLSIIDLEVRNRGFGYKRGDILTINLGGSVGIPTTGESVSPLTITIDEIYNQKFSGWSFGQLQIFDPIESLFNGIRRLFPLEIDKELKSILAKTGSPIDVNATFLVFINGILQNPGSNYTLFGSSYILFSEAPKPDSSCLILFYRGNGVSDVIDVDVISPIKSGDNVKLNDDNGFSQDERTISKILSATSIETIPYNGKNIVEDVNYLRPINLCLQTEDLFINGKEVAKDREIYDAMIEPTTKIIKNVGLTTTIIFVENAKTFFDDQRENALNAYRNKLKIISQENNTVALGTAIVSVGGTVSSVILTDPGDGYSTSPIITFSNPPGLTTEFRASATASISLGSVSSISIVSGGSSYSQDQPPQVLFSNPRNIVESITANSITGDFGLLTGVSTASIGIGSTALIFNLYIPQDSPLRKTSIVGSAITISGIQTGYYFSIKNTFIGNGLTSLENDGSPLAIGSTFIDNVYNVMSVSIGQTFVSGVGITNVTQVMTGVNDDNIAGLGFTQLYGTYSWGRIVVNNRNAKNQFFAHYDNENSAIVKRVNPLKNKNYS